MFWNPQVAYDNHKNIKEVLFWLDKESLEWTNNQCRFNETHDYQIKKLEEFGLRNISVVK